MSAYDGMLRRSIGVWSATILVIANIVGTGIFVTTGLVLQAVGSPGKMVACWMLGGVFALAGALCYAEMGVAVPRAGGEYAFIRAAFGDRAAFVAGWISLLVGFSAPIAAAAMACSHYIVSSWPCKVSDSLPTLVAVGLVVLFSLVHSCGVGTGTRVQNVLTVLKLVVLTGFCVAAGWCGTGSWANLQATPNTLGSAAWGAALLYVSFAYSGWNAAAYLAGEVRNPGRVLPLALCVGTGTVIGLYLLLNLVFVYAVPPADLRGAVAVGSLAAQALFGTRIGGMVGGAMALCLLSVVSAMIMVGPRVYYAMASDGLLPRVFSSTNRCHVPASAIWLQAGMAIVMIMSATFDLLLLYIGCTLSLCAAVTVAGMFRLRRCADRPVTFRVPLYPLVPLGFIAGTVLMIGYAVWERPAVAAWSALTMVSGLALYEARRRKGPQR